MTFYLVSGFSWSPKDIDRVESGQTSPGRASWSRAMNRRRWAGARETGVRNGTWLNLAGGNSQGQREKGAKARVRKGSRRGGAGPAPVQPHPDWTAMPQQRGGRGPPWKLQSRASGRRPAPSPQRPVRDWGQAGQSSPSWTALAAQETTSVEGGRSPVGPAPAPLRLAFSQVESGVPRLVQVTEGAP